MQCTLFYDVNYIYMNRNNETQYGTSHTSHARRRKTTGSYLKDYSLIGLGDKALRGT